LGIIEIVVVDILLFFLCSFETSAGSPSEEKVYDGADY
jgi:hypothetical protein